MAKAGTKVTGTPRSTGPNRLVVAVTGASGMIYAKELFAYLATRSDLLVHAVASDAGEEVLRLELGLSMAEIVGPRTIVHSSKNFAAPNTSSSCLFTSYSLSSAFS